MKFALREVQGRTRITRHHPRRTPSRPSSNDDFEIEGARRHRAGWPAVLPRPIACWNRRGVRSTWSEQQTRSPPPLRPTYDRPLKVQAKHDLCDLHCRATREGLAGPDRSRFHEAVFRWLCGRCRTESRRRFPATLRRRAHPYQRSRRRMVAAASVFVHLVGRGYEGVSRIASLPRYLRHRTGRRSRSVDTDRSPFLGRAAIDPGRWTPGLARDPLWSKEPAGDRQGTEHRHGATCAFYRGSSQSSCRKAVVARLAVG